jgi:integration host factor subunit beta
MSDTSAEKAPAQRSLTKADLVAGVARRLDFTQVQAAIVVDSFLKGVVTALKKGEEVEIRGLGSFRFRARAPRKGRNPKTGERVEVPAKRVPYFRMGKELKAILGGSVTPS